MGMITMSFVSCGCFDSYIRGPLEYTTIKPDPVILCTAGVSVEKEAGATEMAHVFLHSVSSVG